MISGAQTEIAIFLFAICAHTVLFGGYRIGGRDEGKKLGRSASARGARSATPPSSPLPLGAPNSAAVRAVQALLSAGASRENFTEELSNQVSKADRGSEAEVLAGLLSGLGKAATANLLAACRDVLQDHSLHPCGRVGELLLRAYLGLRLKDEFDQLLAEVEAQQGQVPAVSAIALRSAIYAGDLETALRRLLAVAAAWKLGAASTPSAAHGQIFQQLLRLATEKSALPTLVAELEACGMLVPWTIEAVLVECAQIGDAENLRKTKELAAARGVALTAGAYAALLGRAAGRAALRTLDEAASKGLTSKEVLLAATASASARGDSALAEAVVKYLPANPEKEVAAAVLQLCAAGGPLAGQDPDAAVLRLYKQHFAGLDFSVDAKAQRLIVDVAVRHGQVDVLRQVMAVAADTSRQVVLVKSFAAERRLQDSIRVFKACPEKASCLYNALLDACIDSRDLKTAEMVMSEAIASKKADVVTYNTMIKAQLQNGDARAARSTVEAMRAAGLEPNCVTFNELIDATIRERSDSVWGLVKEMQVCGLKPNHVTCSIVLKSIQRSSKASDVEKALAVVENMEDNMDEVLLSSVCEACIRACRPDLLVRQLRKTRDPRRRAGQGCPHLWQHHQGLWLHQRHQGGLGPWNQMKARHIVPTSVTLGCMVEALASNGEPEAGYELIREQMRDPQTCGLVNAVIYCSVLKGFSHRKRFDQVWEVYEEMKVEKLQFSIVTYNTLIDACSRSGEMGRIQALLEEMASAQIDPNLITYSTVIKGYCQENRLHKAFELLEDMKRTKQFCPDEVTYNTLLDGCARYGMWDRGIALLDEMEKAGVAPSNFTLSVLVKLANRSKRPDKGFELTESLCAKYHIRLNVHVFNNLVHCCTAHGDLRKGLEVLERMLREKVRPDPRTYMLLLRGCISAQAPDDAAGLLRAAAGLRGAHPVVGNNGSLAQPKGGLASELVSEVLEGIAGACSDEGLAVQLLRDLRGAPGIALDPRLPIRLTSKAIGRQR